MSDLVGNPENRFSSVAAHIASVITHIFAISFKSKIIGLKKIHTGLKSKHFIETCLCLVTAEGFFWPFGEVFGNNGIGKSSLIWGKNSTIGKVYLLKLGFCLLIGNILGKLENFLAKRGKNLAPKTRASFV